MYPFAANRSIVTLIKSLTTRCHPFAATPSLFRTLTTDVSALDNDRRNLIKQLRERTSAPMKDVKASLEACSWDIEAAQRDLRKRGMVIASKKSARTATEGLLAVAQDDKRAVVVELNCETDFVARNDIFQHLASSLARMALSAEDPSKKDELAFPFGSEYLENMKINLNHPKLTGETTVQSAITEVAAMVGENVKFRRGFVLSTSSHGVVSTYLHTCPQPGLCRIAGIVALEATDAHASLDALQMVGSSLAMHIVAAKPLFISKELVPSEAIESERDILKSRGSNPEFHVEVRQLGIKFAGQLIRRSSNKATGTSMRILINENMSKDVEISRPVPGVVGRLMGLDEMPHRTIFACNTLINAYAASRRNPFKLIQYGSWI